MRTAIDTNVILALWSGSPLAARPARVCRGAAREGGPVLCGPVYAELMVHLKATVDFVDLLLRNTRVGGDFTLDERVWPRAAQRLAVHAR